MKEMMKQKMMNRFHKRNSSSASSVDFKPGERLDFKFSSLQALQVPSGWDKLSISLISIETDKTVAKTGKASVCNGNCRWAETLSESIWLSQDDSSKELQQCLYKLLISKGSTRSSILGEATVNLSSYMSSEASLPVALPLKKCEHGTILQVAIQCLTPRPNSRWSDTNSHADSSDLDNMSDAAPNGFDTKPIGTSTTNSIRDSSNALGSRETSFASVRSHHSFDSMDSFGRESSHSNLSDATIDLIGKPESTTTVNVYNTPSSSKNLLNRRQDSGKVSHNIPASPLRTFSSSEYAMEDEVATEELRAEARTWERNARKLMVDLELSRKVTSDQTRNLENVTMELSALQAECDDLKNEVKHLKILLGESEIKERDADNLKVQVQDKNGIQAELEEEVKFLKDLNNNLSMQLNKNQESNLEFVSVLQELEETIEKQKLEINSLMEAQQSAVDEDNGEEDTRVEASKATEKEICELKLELQKFQESQQKLESSILSLEETLEEKTREIELERDLKTQTLLDIDSEWTKKISLKDEQILNLEAKLSEAIAAPVLKETESQTIETSDLIEEVKALKDKVLELERDCNELTDENLDLLFKLKESSKDLSVSGTSTNCSSGERPSTESTNFEESEVEYSLKDNNGKLDNAITELKSKIEDLNKELFAKSSEIQELKSDCLLKEEEIQSQNNCLEDLEAKLSDLQLVNSQLEKSLTEYKESTHLEAENSESQVLKLQDEIKRLENEVETMQKRWLEAQEECDYLKKENPKLQATTESLMEECSSLQKSNNELRQQISELHNHCTNVEEKLKESEDSFLKLSKNLVNLEENLSTMVNEIASKEKAFDSELKTLHLQFTEESSHLEVLNKSLNEVKQENERLEASYQTMSGDYQQLKEEKTLLLEKSFSMQKAVMEVEDLKRKNFAMEEKLLRLEGNPTANTHDENVEGDKVDESSRIKSLELALDEALEANKMYKIQLQSLLSEKEGRESGVLMELKVKDEGINEEHKNNVLLKAELNELQERYLNMSLKYAEVEAQREDLVLKLKNNGHGRSWFS